MNHDRLMRVIVGPHISEKAYRIADGKNKQVTFKVLRDASKPEIKKAIEMLFEVKVKDVNTVQVKGQERRFGKIIGRTQDWKKAYVTLHEGHDIALSDSE
jgi:large subunit ribosomal protein L23